MIAIIMASLMAASPIQLEEARHLSRSNTRVLQAELDRLRGRAQQTTLRAGLLPQVNLSGTAGISRIGPQRSLAPTPVQDPTTGEIRYEQRVLEFPAYSRNTFDLTVNLSQMLVDAGLWAQMFQAKAELEAVDGQAFEERMLSELEAIRRFYQLFRAQRSLEVLEARVRDDEALLERATALFEGGKRGREDVITARVNLGNDRIQAILERARVASASSDLAVWLGREGTEELVAVDPGTLEQLPLQPPELADAVQLALANRPLVHALQALVRASDKGVTVARAGYLPRLSTSLLYNRNSPSSDPFFTDLSQQNSFAASLNLSWNLFAGFQTSGQVRDAELDLERRKLTLAQFEKDLMGDVYKALVTLRAQLEAAQVAADNLQLARDGLEMMRDLYAAGTVSTLQLRDAQLKLTNAELFWLQSRVEVEVARALLDRTTGVLSNPTP